MQHNLILLSEVKLRTGYSRAWIYRLISENRFPRPIKLGKRSIAFVENEIDEWINQRITESRNN